MAVFFLNQCKFNHCGLEFPSLKDLIQHIENEHIDYDPAVIEQKEKSQPACLPLSYVLRFITDAARKENQNLFISNTGTEVKRKLAIKHHSYSMSSSNRSNTPTGSEMDEDEIMVSESEDSNDSWTTEEFSPDFIMRYGSRSSAGTNGAQSNEKPFACPVPGCKKRYKNVNGIKYHSKNGHKKDGKIRKGYKCHCGKSYKTAQGLKSHTLFAHSNASTSDLSLNSLSSSTPSSSSSSLNSTQILASPDGAPISTNLNQTQIVSPSSIKNSINLVTIKSKTGLIGSSNSCSSSSSSSGILANKITKIVHQSDNSSDKTKTDKMVVPQLTKFENLGILTPATSPKLLQQQQQQQQMQLGESSGQSSQILTNNLSGSTENLQIPISPASSTSSSSMSIITSNKINGFQVSPASTSQQIKKIQDDS